MNRKQIRRDYENVDYIDEKGRVRTKVRYRGAHYTLEDPEQIGIFRGLYVALAALAVALFVPPLCFNLDVLRTIYFTIFYVPQVFCLFVMGLGAYHVLFTKLPYREEVYAQVFSRAWAAAIASAAMSLAAVVAFAVYAGLVHAGGLDYLALGCVLGLLAVDAAFAINVRARKINRLASPPAMPEATEATEVTERKPEEDERGDDGEGKDEGDAI